SSSRSFQPRLLLDAAASAPGTASAATATGGATAPLEWGIRAGIYDMAIQEKICQLRGEYGKFRITVEDMRDTFEAVEFHRHANVTKLLREIDAVVDGNRRVLVAMEDCDRRKPGSDISRCVGLATVLISAAGGHHRARNIRR